MTPKDRLSRHIEKYKCNSKKSNNIEVIDISNDEIDIKREQLIETTKINNSNSTNIGHKKRTRSPFINADPLVESISNLEWNRIDNSLAVPNPKIQFMKEPAPLIVEFYSCPASNRQKPCPKYETEEKVRQHIEFFHKIYVEQQMQFFQTIQKHVL